MKSCRNILPNLALLIGIALCAGTAEATTYNLNGRVDIDRDYVNPDYVGHVGKTESTVVRQRDHDVDVLSNNNQFGASGTVAAYLLESGRMTIPDARYYQYYGDYTLFRQTGGGYTNIYSFTRRTGQVTDDTIRSDFIFGGNASALIAIGNDPGFCADSVIAVIGSAHVYANSINRSGDTANFRHMIAVNDGGRIDASVGNGNSRLYVPFNGGTYHGRSSGLYMFGQNSGSSGAAPTWIRVYEAGGCIVHSNDVVSDNRYFAPPPVCDPVGNVVLSIDLPDSVKNNNGAGWDFVPAVVIKDETTAGSNAVAVADYDFDSRTITNITIICRGENYSGMPGDVTAELRYKATGNALATMNCTVGPCKSGPFTWAGGGQGAIQIQYATHTYSGPTVIDMDRYDEADHRDHTGEQYPDYRRSIVTYSNRSGYILNSTSIVIRSGLIWAGISLNTTFPSATRLELYGGHLGNNGGTFTNVVVGGETWLRGFSGGGAISVTVPTDGTLEVDYGAVVTNGVIVLPKLKYGTVTLNSGVKIKAKGWEKLPRGKKVPILDLSGVTTFTTKANATLVQGDEGDIFWGEGDDANILYARRRTDGYFMIFK